MPLSLRLASLVISAGLAWGAAMDARARRAPPPAPIRLHHGPDRAQTIDLWLPDHARGPTALVVFIHGGGWIGGTPARATGHAKITHALACGQAFAAIGYRPVPQVTIEDQAAEIAAAIAMLLDHAADYHIDPRRVIVMGHSAGAHLAALIGTDRRWLGMARVEQSAIAGIIAIDGVAYDVVQQMRAAPIATAVLYHRVFGRDPARLRALSPVCQASAPNVVNWLLLHRTGAGGAAQAAALAATLRRSGSIADVLTLPGRGMAGHIAGNRCLGDADWPVTRQVDQWIDRVLAGRSISTRFS